MKAESPGLAPAYGGWYAPVDLEVTPSPQALFCNGGACIPPNEHVHALCWRYSTDAELVEARLKWKLKAARAARPAKESGTCMPCGD